MKKICILILCTLALNMGHAQQLIWQADFEQILDNREYPGEITYDIDRTIFGAKANANIGLSYKDKHKILIGGNLFKEYGDELKSERSFLNLFYQYDTEKLQIYLGQFNRKHTLNYPRLFLNDTLQYYQPNISGAYLKYQSDWGYQDLWIDWTQKQGDYDREQFIAGTSGKYAIKNFYVENYMYLFHYALPRLNKDQYNIRDNGAFAAFLGYQFEKNDLFDLLKIDLGGVANFDRDRKNGSSINLYTGLMPRIQIEKNSFGLNASYYTGDKIRLPKGEPLYQSGEYLRTECYYHFIKTETIQSSIKLNFHLVDRIFTNSQQLFVYIKLDKLDISKD